MNPYALFDKYAQFEPTEWIDVERERKVLVRLKPELKGLSKEEIQAWQASRPQKPYHFHKIFQ